MKDVLNGISVFNPLGGKQTLLPIPTDLIEKFNGDDKIEIDASQGVNKTQDKSDSSLTDSHVKCTRKSVRSSPLKNAQYSKCNAS
jgi:hypothetical protein